MMGCEPLAFIGFLVLVLGGAALLVFLIYVCCWAYNARDCADKFSSIERGAAFKESSLRRSIDEDLRFMSVRLTSLEDRLARIEGKSTVPSKAPRKR